MNIFISQLTECGPSGKIYEMVGGSRETAGGRGRGAGGRRIGRGGGRKREEKGEEEREGKDGGGLGGRHASIFVNKGKLLLW